MSWFVAARGTNPERVRVQLARRYTAVRLRVAATAVPVAVVVALTTGPAVGLEVAVVPCLLLLDGVVAQRRRPTEPRISLVVDTTVVGVMAVLIRLPVVAGMGTALVVVTIGTLAAGRWRVGLLGYAVAWLLAAMSASFVAKAGYSNAQIHLLTTVSALFYVASITGMVIGVMGEMTRRDREREETARHLADSEERFRTLVQEAFDAVVVIDAAGAILFASGAYERVTGFSLDERFGSSVRDHLHPDDVPIGRQILHDSLAQPGTTVRGVVRASRRDGASRTLEVALTNLLHKPLVGGLVGNFRDVTDRIRAEGALRETEQRFRSAFDGAPIGMALVSVDGRFLEVNGALTELLGHSEESLLGMGWRDVAPPEEAPETDEAIHRLLDGPDGTIQMPRSQMRADGSICAVTMSISAVRDAAGRPDHLIMQATDITAAKRAQEDLERALRFKDEFVASVSHELRTPLTSVVGFTRILEEQDGALASEERRDLIETIAREGEDLVAIVEDLLVIARSEPGAIEVARVPVDLRRQAEQVLAVWDRDAGHEIRVGDGAARALGDPTRVRQVLRNLISNAVKYGGRRIRVEFGESAGTASVIVADDGSGIPEAERERVFAPYERLHALPGLTSSLGLGLTVSRRLARLMGGDLEHHTDSGESVFEFTLPAAPARASAPPASSEILTT